jgi:membrane fusion protein, multidrug efflux system
MNTTLASPEGPASASASESSARRPSPTNPSVRPPKRKILKPLAIGLVAAAAAVWLVRAVVHAYRYEKTDNAYVIGRIHQISPQIDGQVQAVLVNDNQIVKAGDPLVRLDPAEFEIAVQKAQAALAQARAQQTESGATISQAGAQLAEAEARVAQAEAQTSQSSAQLALAQLTSARNEKLFADGGAVTQADVDASRSGFAVATASQSAAKANLTAAQASVRSAHAAEASARAQADAAEANVAAAAAMVRDAGRKLGYTTLIAPTDGRIGNRLVEAGNRVQAGQTLLALAELQVWVVANFKETQLARMVPGTPVEMTVDALPGEKLPGKIDSFSPASGAQFALLPPDNATGNFNKVVQRVPVKITFDAADLQRLGNRLRLGLSVVVEVRVR